MNAGLIVIILLLVLSILGIPIYLALGYWHTGCPEYGRYAVLSCSRRSFLQA